MELRSTLCAGLVIGIAGLGIFVNMKGRIFTQGWNAVVTKNDRLVHLCRRAYQVCAVTNFDCD